MIVNVATRTTKPAALANFSDEDWQALSIGERQKLLKDLATQNEADVEAGKSAGIITIDPKSVSTANEVSGGLGGTDAERRYEIEKTKNANKLRDAAEGRASKET